MLREQLIRENILSIEQLEPSQMATFEDLLFAHSPNYITEIKTGNVDMNQFKRIGFPWSEKLFERSVASVYGTKNAAIYALKNKIAGNLAGGTHHAHYDRGEGFCVFNDIAVATNFLLENNMAKKIAIIDLDVHQGNGNSSILGHKNNVFILSLHGEKNYPYQKVNSHLDIGLPDFCDDDLYLENLNNAMKAIVQFQPDFIFYQMGVDALKEDKLGKLNLTFEGLMKRDEIVLNYAHQNNIPLTLTLGGGYAEPIELTVQAYANTYRVAKNIYLF